MSKEMELYKQAKEHFEPDEERVQHVFGAYECKILGKNSARNGIMIATNKRLVFYAKKLGGYDLEVFPYENISSIESGKSLMGHTVTFYSSGNKVSMKWIRDKERAIDFIKQVKSRIGKKPANAKEEVAATNDDIPTQIKRLAELKDAGILTEEEFASKKAELLSKM